MPVLEDYQTKMIGELFNPEVIEQSIENVDSLSPQEEAVLQFIVDNPEEQYIELQNTFTMPDKLVISLVLEYGAPSDEYERLRRLKEEVSSD